MRNGLKVKHIRSFKTGTKETYRGYFSLFIHKVTKRKTESFTLSCKFALFLLPLLDTDTLKSDADKKIPPNFNFLLFLPLYWSSSKYLPFPDY